jgi:aryl-alcohol dehydrogenase-like predicted oxidoreductase
MNYRFLGKTGFKVSELCLGSMTFGRETNEVGVCQILNLFIDAGVIAPMIGARTLEQFEANLGAVGWALSSDLMNQLTPVRRLAPVPDKGSRLKSSFRR